MATFAIFIWPLVGMAIFSALGRSKGLIWSVLIGYLFLPEAWTFNLPGLPPYGKLHAISLGVLLGVLATRDHAEPLPKADRRARAVQLAVVLLFLVSPFLTMIGNRDGTLAGPFYLRPVGLWDVQAQFLFSLVTLVPFFFAKRLLYSPEMHRELLKAMVILALGYALLALYEVRMSPQLNRMVYGYFPHSWLQHIRGGAWRPLVFLQHGLELGFYLMTAVLAAIGLVRATAGAKVKEHAVLFTWGGIALFAVLAISRNLGAFSTCVALGLAAIFLSPRAHVRIAAVVAILFMAYPMTKEAYIQPLLAFAERVSEDRYGSIKFRFDNEDLLLARANERPVVGWGPRGRSRVYNDYGRDITTSDGLWIIQLGKWGWAGFIGLFGLLIAPILLVKRTTRTIPVGSMTSVLTLMVAANLVYMIPNATLTPIGWLVAGALAGYVQFMPASAYARDKAAEEPGFLKERRLPGYTRFARHSSKVDPVKHSRY